jgi:hypothetical protein
LLDLRRLVEEVPGRRRGLRDHLRRNTMPAQIEKPRPCAGRPDFCRHRRQIRSGHVDHRQGILDDWVGHGASSDNSI